MLILTTFLMYLMRSNLSIAIIPIAKIHSLSNVRQGLLLSSFFYGCAAFQLPSGEWISRYGAHSVLMASMLTSCFATALVPLVAHKSNKSPVEEPNSVDETVFVSLFVVRLITGIGQASTYPCIASLVGKYVPPEERSLMAGFYNVSCVLLAESPPFFPALIHTVTPARERLWDSSQHAPGAAAG